MEVRQCGASSTMVHPAGLVSSCADGLFRFAVGDAGRGVGVEGRAPSAASSSRVRRGNRLDDDVMEKEATPPWSVGNVDSFFAEENCNGMRGDPHGLLVLLFPWESGVLGVPNACERGEDDEVVVEVAAEEEDAIRLVGITDSSTTPPPANFTFR